MVVDIHVRMDQIEAMQCASNEIATKEKNDEMEDIPIVVVKDDKEDASA